MAAHNKHMVFNYPLPTEYYPQSQDFYPQWTTPTSPQSSVPRTIPAGNYVDPRKLQRSYSSSSDEIKYYPSTCSLTMSSSRQRMYPVILHQSHGHSEQSAYVPTGYLESSGGRRG